MDAEKVLVADIGGTNARFALADVSGQAELTQVKYYKAADYPSFEDVVEDYLGKLKAPVDRACLAVASPVQGDQVNFTNNSWSFSQKSLARHFSKLKVINDFEAVAFSVEALKSEQLIELSSGISSEAEVRAVVGPGTGLGMALLVRKPQHLFALATEGGHAAWAPQGAYQQKIHSEFAKGFDFVCREEILSGRGLVQLAQAIASIDGLTLGKEELRPEWVSGQAIEGHPFASKVVEEFFSILGAVAGDFVLQTGATGGLYLAGGILPRVAELLKKSSFRSSFENKGRYRAYMEKIPCFLMTDKDLGLKGAAVSLRYESDVAKEGES